MRASLFDKYDSQIEEFDYIFKIILVGEEKVGKTNIMQKFTRNVFSLEYKPNIGVEFSTRGMLINEKVIQLQVWDSKFFDRYEQEYQDAFYKCSVAALIIIDLTNRESIDDIQLWIQQIKKISGEETIINVVGNKKDLERLRQIKAKEMIESLENLKQNVHYFETSALTNEGIDEVFMETMKQVYTRMNNPNYEFSVNHKEVKGEYIRKSYLQKQEEIEQLKNKQNQGSKCQIF